METIFLDLISWPIYKYITKSQNSQLSHICNDDTKQKQYKRQKTDMVETE